MAWYDKLLGGGEPDLPVYRSDLEISKAGYVRETTLETREIPMGIFSRESSAARMYIASYNAGRAAGQRANAALISDRRPGKMRVSAIITASRQTVRTRR
ncbi:MAG: hypothetical protein HY513_03525 [Candidatus Aenigmarchaeota archaeon]|nr:hypothetical protein [Candidatus Aenigmarchaeota archaeon]